MHKLTIRPTKTGRGQRLFLDDLELTGVNTYRLEYLFREHSALTLKLTVKAVDVGVTPGPITYGRSADGDIVEF